MEQKQTGVRERQDRGGRVPGLRSGCGPAHPCCHHACSHARVWCSKRGALWSKGLCPKDDSQGLRMERSSEKPKDHFPVPNKAPDPTALKVVMMP